jgi:hypothetical protein
LPSAGCPERGAHTGITTPKKVITMTLRTIAHHLGLPVRRDPQEVTKIIEGLRPTLDEASRRQAETARCRVDQGTQRTPLAPTLPPGLSTLTTCGDAPKRPLTSVPVRVTLEVRHPRSSDHHGRRRRDPDPAQILAEICQYCDTTLPEDALDLIDRCRMGRVCVPRPGAAGLRRGRSVKPEAW